MKQGSKLEIFSVVIRRVLALVLASFDAWKAMTSDLWVLDAVQEYKIVFGKIPRQTNLPKQINFNETDENLVDSEVKSMLEEGAIFNSRHEEGEFVSNIFIVPKPNGKVRPVINLKHLKKYVHYEHFKQETPICFGFNTEK